MNNFLVTVPCKFKRWFINSSQQKLFKDSDKKYYIIGKYSSMREAKFQVLKTLYLFIYFFFILGMKRFTLKINVMVICVIECNYLVQVKSLSSVNGAISIAFNFLPDHLNPQYEF